MLCGKNQRDATGLACLSKTCIDRWYSLLPEQRTQLELDFAAGKLKKLIKQPPRKCLTCNIPQNKAEYPSHQPNYCKQHRRCAFCLVKDRRPILRGSAEMDLCCEDIKCVDKFSNLSADEVDQKEAEFASAVFIKTKKGDRIKKTVDRKRKHDEEEFIKEGIDIHKRPKAETPKPDSNTPQAIMNQFIRLLQKIPFDESAIDRLVHDTDTKLKAYPLFSMELLGQKHAVVSHIKTIEMTQIKPEFRHIAIKFHMFQCMVQCLATGSNWATLPWIPLVQAIHSSALVGSSSSSSSLELESSSELALDSSSSLS
jgi:hypothetical protein